MSLKTQYPKEWNIWYNMNYRCHKNKTHYEDISVCAEWQDFERFLSDMGPRPHPTYSIDRIDPCGDYEPANCRWTDKSTQARNTRNKQDRTEYFYWLDVALKNGISNDTFRARVGKMGLDWEYAATVKRVPGSGQGPKS